MQFIITAYDFKDNDAINRRLANRANHLSGLDRMVKDGSFLSGGAILNSEGKMIGSSAHVVFNSKLEVEEWIKQDPYTTGRVWQTVEIQEAALLPISHSLETTRDK